MMTHRLISTEQVMALIDQPRHDILTPHEGSILCVQIKDLYRVDYLVVKEGKLTAHPSVDHPHLTMSGHILEFNPNMPFQSVVIEGSAPIAKALLEHAKTIHIRPPERLLKIIPSPFDDITALAFHQFTKLLSRQLTFIQNSSQDGP